MIPAWHFFKQKMKPLKRSGLSDDPGGLYWVSKTFYQGLNINKIFDRGFSVSNMDFVNPAR